MRRSRFSLEEINDALRLAAGGMAVSEIAARLGISQQTFYRWKKSYSGLPPGHAQELKVLREENARLKKQIEQLRRDMLLLQEIAAKKWEGPR